LKYKPDRGGSDDDADGVRIERLNPPARSYRVPLLAGTFVVLLSVWLVVQRSDRSTPMPNTATSVVGSGEGAEPTAPQRLDAPLRQRRMRAVPRRRAGASDAKQPGGTVASAEVGRGFPPELDAGEYIAWLRAQGDTDGLAAFPPPGTRPPRPGVIVPDDYDLPPGFARHYQSTDDGRQLPPVLVVAPEYDLIGEDGTPIDLGDDRIVPPELAPQDLPVRMLEVPAGPVRGSGER